MRKLSLKKKIKKNKENGDDPAISNSNENVDEKDESGDIDADEEAADEKSSETKKSKGRKSASISKDEEDLEEKGLEKKGKGRKNVSENKDDDEDEEKSDKRSKNRKTSSDDKEEDGADEKLSDKKSKSKKAASDDENEDEEEQEEDEEEYEVEDIVDHKVERGRSMYLIRWKGYGADADTWEPENTLTCPDLIAKYKKKTQGKKKKGKRSSAGGHGGTSKKKSKKQKHSEDEDEDDAGSEENNAAETTTEDEGKTDDKEWEVEKVVDVVTEKDGTRAFRIRWKGYRPSSDTWEPEANLNCADLIEKFLKKRKEHDESDKKELREDPKKTQRYATNSPGRRASKRNSGRQRTVYYDAE